MTELLRSSSSSLGEMYVNYQTHRLYPVGLKIAYQRVGDLQPHPQFGTVRCCHRFRLGGALEKPIVRQVKVYSNPMRKDRTRLSGSISARSGVLRSAGSLIWTTILAMQLKARPVLCSSQHADASSCHGNSRLIVVDRFNRSFCPNLLLQDAEKAISARNCLGPLPP